MTRPDLRFDVFLHSQKKVPKVEDVKMLNKTVKRIADQKCEIKYVRLNSQRMRILLYTDASLGNL